MCAHPLAGEYGIAALNLADGRFTLCQAPDVNSLLDELARLQPAELLVCEGSELEQDRGIPCNSVVSRAAWHFDDTAAANAIRRQYRVDRLDGLGCADLPAATAAAGALLQYVNETQSTALLHLQPIKVEHRSDSIIVDAVSRRNLELEQDLRRQQGKQPAGRAGHDRDGHGQPAAQTLVEPALARSACPAPAP